jgi:hypothetical protein
MIKLDKFTYGKTPAAIYLAELLNTLDAPKLARKVSRTLVDFNELINQIEASNDVGILSAHNIGYLAAMLRIRAQDTWLDDNMKHCTDESDESLVLVNNLVHNILIGRIKDLSRRVQMVRIYEHQRATSKSAPTKPLKSVEDSINAESLVKRSTARLIRLNKINTMY